MAAKVSAVSQRDGSGTNRYVLSFARQPRLTPEIESQGVRTKTLRDGSGTKSICAFVRQAATLNS